jgi:hypothetical protein
MKKPKRKRLRDELKQAAIREHGRKLLEQIGMRIDERGVIRVAK